MPRFIVSRPDDPQLADYQSLNERNLTRQSGKFIAEGDKVVQRLIASPYEVSSIFADAHWADQLEPLVPPETPIYVADGRLLEQTIGYNFHRGVLAVGRRGPRPQLAQVLEKLPKSAITLICPEIHDPSNLGSLIRTAAAFGVAAIVLGSQCAHPFSRRVLRVSMGAALQLPLVESNDLRLEIELLRAHQFDIAATVLDTTAIPLQHANRSTRQAILLGSEGHGLGDEWLKLSDRRITLAMLNSVDSLNVAIATAVFLYHFTSNPPRGS